MEKEGFKISQPAADFGIVQAILDSPGCEKVAQVWFQVGTEFCYNGFSRARTLFVERTSKRARLPDIPAQTRDAEFLVLLLDAGMVRRLAAALRRCP